MPGFIAGAGLGPRSGAPADLAACEAGLLRSDETRRAVLSLARPTGETVAVAVRCRLMVLNPWLLIHAATSADMVVVLPRFVGEPEVATGRLEPVLPDWSVVVASASILFPSKRFLRPASRACIDFFAHRLRHDLRAEAGPPVRHAAGGND